MMADAILAVCILALAVIVAARQKSPSLPACILVVLAAIWAIWSVIMLAVSRSHQ